MSLVLLPGLVFGAGAGLGSVLAGSETTATTAGSTTTVGQTATTSAGRTITSSTELISGTSGSNPIMWLMHGDAPAAGIQIYEARGPARSASPGELYLKARVAGGQDAGAYEAIAERILTLSERYKQGIYFDRLRVVLAANGGEVVYDHTFQVTPPSSTTSTAQPFLTHYSAPRLDVSPRGAVSLNVNVSQNTQGTVWAGVEIRNSSGSPFRFSEEDLQLYVNGARAEPSEHDANAPVEVGGGSVVTRYIYFELPYFDPAVTGLLYISNDPQSKGFTASDGPV